MCDVEELDWCWLRHGLLHYFIMCMAVMVGRTNLRAHTRCRTIVFPGLGTSINVAFCQMWK